MQIKNLFCTGSMLVLLAAMSLMPAYIAQAQNTEVTPPASPQPFTAAAPIAVKDILARADEEQQRVDMARQLLAAPSPVEQLQATLDGIANPVKAKQHTPSDIALRQLPIMRLESLARHWEFDARRYAYWEVQARRAFAPYDDTAVELAQRRAIWSATRAAGLLDGLPIALSNRVDALLVQIDETETALGEVLARQFALSRHGSELKAHIESGRKEVAAAIEDIDDRLLHIDAPPLWHGLGATNSPQVAFAAMQRSLEIEQQFAADYGAAGTANQWALHILQVLLLPLILCLSIRLRHIPQDGAGGVQTRVLHRPVSAWLMLSMLSVLLFEPDAPLLVQEIALLIALIPVLRLLPPGLLRLLGVWPYIAIALYGLDRLSSVAVTDTGLYRLFLFLLNTLALILTIRMLRQPLPAAATALDERLKSALELLSWAVLTALLVAALSNIAGNVSLAEMLTSGVIDSGYMALLLYCSVTVCLAIQSAILLQPFLANHRLVQRYGPMVELGLSRLLILGALLGWLLYSMYRFRVLRPLLSVGSAVMRLGVEVGEVSLHLGDVLVFLFSVWLANWAARIVRRLLRDELHGHSQLPRGVGNSIASLSYYSLLALGFLIALSAAGFKLSQLAFVFGALGVGIGFGLQNVVNNFVSGVVLMFERPIQPGDIVDAAGTSGTVRVIGLRSTTIRTFDGADSVVPNGLLLSSNLTNWTMFDRSRRFEIAISVGYSSSAAQVLSVLEAAARATPGVADEPPPVVLMIGFGESALNFVVRAWTSDLALWMNVRGDLLAQALGALKAAGISIPYNQIDLNVRSVPASMEARESVSQPGRNEL